MDVVSHLLARRNQRVPANDGRTINLLLFGGLMTCVQSAGAMTAFLDLGLEHAFDNIYTASAGFANASYLLSGNGYAGISIYFEDLPHRKFLKLLRFWRIVDIDFLISIMQHEKPLNIPHILDSRTKIWVRLYEIQSGTSEYLEIHDYPKEYWSLMRASMSIPYFCPGTTHIGDKQYKDGGFYDRDELEHYAHTLNQPCTDLVIIYNSFEQYQRVTRNRQSVPPHVLEIYPGSNLHLSRFSKDSEELKANALHMKNLMLSRLGSRGIDD